MTSVSVSLRNRKPFAISSSRRTAKFSMMPLCTMANFPSSLIWGWALVSFGSPWVAQRVWPMPAVPGSVAPPWVFSSRLRIIPMVFSMWMTPSSSTAMPAES